MENFLFPAYVWQVKNQQFVLVAANSAARKIASAVVTDWEQRSPTMLGLPIATGLNRCYQDQISFQETVTIEANELLSIGATERSLLVTYFPLEEDYVGCYWEDISDRLNAEQKQFRQLRNATVLSQLGQESLAETDLDKLMAHITKTIATNLEIEFANVLELLPNETLLTFRAATGWPKSLQGTTISAGTRSIAGFTLHHRQTTVVEDFHTEARFRTTPLLFNQGILSGICAVIPGEDKPFGVLCAYSRQIRSYSASEVEFLEAIAAILTAAVKRHHIEAELNLMKRAIDASRNGIVISDVIAENSPTIYVNPSFEEMTGYQAEEILGRNCRFLHGQDYQQPGLAIVRQALAEGRSCRAVLRNYRKDNSLFWNELYLAPVHNEQGHLTHYIGIQSDITAQKQAEEQLHQQALMFELIYDGVAAIALDGTIIDWNPGAERIFGLTPTEALGQPMALLSNTQPLDFRSRILPTLETQGHWVGQLSHRRYDGTTKICETTIVPLKDDSNNTIGAISVSHDITHRQEVETALRNERDLLNGIMQTSVAAIAVVDAMGNIIFANDRAEEILGLTQDEIAQLSSHNRGEHTMKGRGLPLPNEQLPFEQVMQTGEPIFNVQHILISAQGDRRYLSINGSPLKDANNQITGVVFSASDISQRYLAEMALRESEERLSTIITATSDALIVLDQQSQIRFANPAAERLFGRQSDNLINASARELYTPRDTTEVLIHRPDGHRSIAEMRVVKMTWNTEQVYLASLRDVSERHATQAALKKSEEQFRLLFELAPTGMALVSLDYRFQRVNQALCKALGYKEDDLMQHSVQEFSDTSDWDLHTEECDRLLQGLISYFQMEKRYVAQSGRSIDTLLQVALARDTGGKPLHFIYQIIDITERKRAEAQLEYNAYYDALTDLPNRTLFMKRLSHTMRRSQRRGNYRFAVLFFDLDYFKVVNDSLGHIVGDRLLVAIARRLEACLRPSDTLARLGGDEFTVLLDGIEDVQVATNMAQKLQQRIQHPFNFDGHEVFTNASIGIAFNSREYQQPEELLRDADTAMYRAKALGKARYAVFTSNMHATALARLQLESDLRRALSRGEIIPYYQPIVSLQTNQLMGFEVLARWQHPQRGLVSPGEFIPIAEETGLIVPLGRWILQQACTQLRQWQVKFDRGATLKMSVNLSGRQLKETNLVAEIAGIIQKAQLPPQALKLEITETLLMDNAKAAAAIFAQLQKMGIELSIDDFGTGYSSLSYLHRFPLNTLKIDRSFINNLQGDRSNLEIVQAIITLAHTLGMDAIAEGIETPAQLAQLQALGCEYGQGYFFSPPLPVDAAEKLIASSFAEESGKLL
ncbi:MAG: PAS domain S-box protein [Jaaginema sp. PMC 1080.18]|nr:PAS domain S-box protein [Jaaginema sp. PMC 1080.18]MEC4867291.1 PAS domain S-box protein [Jaaginema sp. PMC 1078.18]